MTDKPNIRPCKETGGYYKLNLDNKWVYFNPDKNKDYLRDKLHPDIMAQFDRVRERGNPVLKSVIDYTYRLQKEKSINIAIKYLKYRYFGEYTYLEVFGKKSKEDEHMELTEEIHNVLKEQSKKISDLESLVKELITAMVHPGHIKEVEKQENMTM